MLDFHCFIFSCILKNKDYVQDLSVPYSWTHPLSHNQIISSFWTAVYSEEGFKNILKLSTVENYKSMQILKINRNCTKGYMMKGFFSRCYSCFQVLNLSGMHWWQFLVYFSGKFYGIWTYVLCMYITVS